MASLQELRKERLEKLAKLRASGIDPFPIKTGKIVEIGKVLSAFSKLLKNKKKINLAGRIIGLRHQGALVFVDLHDGTGKIQILFKQSEIEDKSFDQLVSDIDRGDFILVVGQIGLSKRGESTLFGDQWRLLTKALRPLPDKWHGLSDTEERYRRRYLDSLMDEEVKERFVTRSIIIGTLRDLLHKAEYLEVETPMLQPLYGGASAEPFTTHHQALDLPLYLRISPELYLKRMLVGGFRKVYELSRCFRNEGIDATHNPEFTMLEFYEAYASAKEEKVFVEKMIKTLVKKIKGQESLIYNGQSINFSEPFETISYFDLLKRHALVPNPETATKQELNNKALQLGLTLPERVSRETIMDQIYKKVCRPKLLQPTFIIDYPKNALPLAKSQPEKPDLVDAFQLIIAGIEIVKAFSELNDPIDQTDRFKIQETKKEEGDIDTQIMDDDFIEALEYGMPPAGGVGIGIDRLVMLLTNVQNIREVIYFPTLRPKN